MIFPGLVSITFRDIAPERLIRLTADAGLDGIEWGGDIHVPHGELETARTVREQTLDAGLQVASYGSYYRVPGDDEEAGEPFEPVLETAVELGAPIIRVWSGRRASADAPEAYRQRVVDESRAIADLVATAGLKIAFEHHGGALTDEADAVASLLGDIARENVTTYWQTPLDDAVDDNLAGLRTMKPWLSHVHVFRWQARPGEPGGYERLGLDAAADEWRGYLQEVAGAAGDHWAMLEYVRGDDPAQMTEDAATLRELVAEANRS